MQLCRYIKGPDFPTGGDVELAEELKEIYKTGSGAIRLRATLNYFTELKLSLSFLRAFLAL